MSCEEVCRDQASPSLPCSPCSHRQSFVSTVQGRREEPRRRLLVCIRFLSLQYLEWREKQYDLRVRVDVFGRDSSEVPTVKGALTYIASADCAKNPNYAGEVCSICAHKATDVVRSH